ncbi:MAG: kinase/pyrophosphorylase, partial [bacterium]|nr:kinase/pyrophosphorylase [bacterium]
VGNYADFEHVRQELNYAYGIFQKHSGWSVIKVTNKPIEEIASQILAILRKRKPPLSENEKTVD